MIIRCIGHASYLIELESGLRIVTDPYDASTGYPVHHVRADVVTVSHGHHDHSAAETVEGWTQRIDREGVHTLAPEVTLEGVPSWHDDAQGAKRGPNLIFVLRAEGLTVAHLGDLGHPLTPEQCAVAPVDVALIPVGGFFTIDAAQALRAAEQLKARVVIPMHYRTQYNASWPIAPLEDFTALLPQKPEELDLLRVTKGDLECQPRVAVLRPMP